MIDVYSCGSPNVLKVLFMLGETGLPFDIKYVDLGAAEQFKPEFAAINPNSRLPAIVDHDGPEGKPFNVFESGAILVYLAEKTGRFYGRTAAERSVVLQWVMFQMAGIGPIFGQVMHFSRAAPSGNDYALARYFSEAVRLCEVLERRLAKSEHIGGASFSIADMATFPWMRKHPALFGIDLSGMPSVERWRTAMEARPGFQRIFDTATALAERTLESLKTATPEALDQFYRRGRHSRGKTA